MGGGLMQLVAYGAQDIYLTGNPQITFFKVVYRRHTNFSMESIKQSFDGSADFGGMVTATISRNGDLVGRMYLEHSVTFVGRDHDGVVDEDDQIGICEHYGHSVIKECEIEIGGQRIDKHTSMWNRVYSDLTEFNPSGHFGGNPGNSVADPSGFEGNGTLYQLMTGNGLGLNTEKLRSSSTGTGNKFSANTQGFGSATPVNGHVHTSGTNGAVIAKIETKVFLPLNFWFNRNPGLALPLIALQYHEVKVKMTFEGVPNLIRDSATQDFVNATPGTIANVDGSPSFNLWCDYIYLDTDERRRFAQVSHEYLIEQLQYSETTLNTQTPSINLNFNHPVKELIWTTRNETGGASEKGGRNQTLKVGKIGDATAGPVSLDEMGGNWQLKLNGHDRFKERDTKYFTRTQVWQHHTGYGAVPTFGQADTGNEPTKARSLGGDSIAVYSFALKPEEHQPSGTCNFSRIDNAQLVGTDVTVFASSGPDTAQLTSAAEDGASNTKLTIFAVNYNVLRIMSGMGGLAYSN